MGVMKKISSEEFEYIIDLINYSGMDKNPEVIKLAKSIVRSPTELRKRKLLKKIKRTAVRNKAEELVNPFFTIIDPVISKGEIIIGRVSRQNVLSTLFLNQFPLGIFIAGDTDTKKSTLVHLIAKQLIRFDNCRTTIISTKTISEFRDLYNVNEGIPFNYFTKNIYKTNPNQKPIELIDDNDWISEVGKLIKAEEIVVTTGVYYCNCLRELREKSNDIIYSLPETLDFITEKKAPNFDTKKWKDRIINILSDLIEEFEPMYNVRKGIEFRKLVYSNNLFEFPNKSATSLGFAVGELLTKLYHYKSKDPESRELFNIVILDDALPLVEISKEQSKMVELPIIDAILTHARWTKIGLIIITQNPSQTSEYILTKCQALCCFRLGGKDLETMVDNLLL